MLHSDPFGAMKNHVNARPEKKKPKSTRELAIPVPEKRSPKAQAEARKVVRATLEKIKQNGKEKKPKPTHNKTYGYKY